MRSQTQTQANLLPQRPVALPTTVQLYQPLHLLLHQRLLRRAVVLSRRKYRSLIPGSESSLATSSSVARANGVDINQLQGNGSGPKGRILREDVEQFLASGGASGAVGVDLSLSPEQMVIAEALTQSKREVPHYYLTVDLNLDQLLEVRDRVNEGNDELEVSVNDFLKG